MALENKEQIYTEKSTLKNWFRSKLKPTQGQFWAWMDSYWHKGEKLPINTIDGLGEAVDGKAPLVHYHEQYATNDASSLADDNVLSWKQKLGVDDLDYVEIPTENATENSHPYVVVINDEGKSAKQNANDFGKVDTVNEIEPDENKNVNIGLDDASKVNSEINRGITINYGGSSLYLNKSQYCLLYDNLDKSIRTTISSSGFYSTQLTLRYPDKPTSVGTDFYDGVVFNFTSSDNVANNNKIQSEKIEGGKSCVTLVPAKSGTMAHTSDIQAIFNQATNWTNASQRFSGLVSKHNDATYNRLLGMDANGYINEVGLPALTNEMSKSTDAQKDAWRIASRKTEETYSTGQPRVDAIYPLVYTNTANRNTQINLLGINLYVNNASSYIRARKIKDLDNADNVGEWFNIDNIESFESMQGLLKISYNLFNITTGIYEVEITHNGLTGQTKPIFYIYSSIVNEDLNQPFVIDQDNGQIEKIDDSSNLVKFSSSLSTNQTSGVVSKKIITSSDSDHDFQINFSSTALDIRYGAGNSNNSRNSISIVDDVTGSTIWNFSTYRSDVYINNKQYGTNLANTTGTMVINVVVRKNIVVTIIDRYGKDTFVDTKTLTIGNSGSKTLMISTNGVHNNASDVYQHKIESLNILK